VDGAPSWYRLYVYVNNFTNTIASICCRTQFFLWWILAQYCSFISDCVFFLLIFYLLSLKRNAPLPYFSELWWSHVTSFFPPRSVLLLASSAILSICGLQRRGLIAYLASQLAGGSSPWAANPHPRGLQPPRSTNSERKSKPLFVFLNVRNLPFSSPRFF
jgi:hypothetical protein